MTYQFLDSGEQKKLESFGSYTLIRPAVQAIWPQRYKSKWQLAIGEFNRENPVRWEGRRLPSSWTISFRSLLLKLALTDFGHIGFFPEHTQHWAWLENCLPKRARILNLFAYSGALTLFLAQLGHSVCHLDASEKMVAWARENAKQNKLEKAAIRWIVDDAMKFVKREIKREKAYDAILLDPPSFGRGSQGQVFKIERDLCPLLFLCRSLLKSHQSLLLLTSHTPGFTPLLLEEILKGTLPKGKVTSGEMALSNEKVALPSGTFARWISYD